MILSTAIASHFPLTSVREDLSFFTHLDRVDLSDNQLGSGLRTSGPQDLRSRASAFRERGLLPNGSISLNTLQNLAAYSTRN